jgi:putative acetyltransferase
MIPTAITRTDSDNPDFRGLVLLLDTELTSLYGELQKWHDQFNIIESNKTVVVAYNGDLPVGCGCFKVFDDVSAEIKRMYVKPEYRGTGIAEKILLELEKWASELGNNFIVLETAIKQPAAIRFYTRLNYKKIENYGPYIGIESSICMRKKLG